MGQKAQLVMLRPHLDDLPEAPPLPRGYLLRTYQDSDMPSLVATLADSFHEYWDDARVALELTAAPDVQTVYVVVHDDRAVGTASSRFVPPSFSTPPAPCAVYETSIRYFGMNCSFCALAQAERSRSVTGWHSGIGQDSAGFSSDRATSSDARTPLVSTRRIAART